jgi:enterochelin esterase-like enzyme
MAGLSMGSMQTSYTTLAHPELFGYAGVFSGFVGSIGKIGPASMDYLHELDDAEKFARDFKVFFRAVGDTDFVALDRFHADDAYFAEKGLSPEQAPNHIVRIYTGAHEWNVWRKCLRDFIQMIF